MSCNHTCHPFPEDSFPFLGTYLAHCRFQQPPQLDTHSHQLIWVVPPHVHARRAPGTNGLPVAIFQFAAWQTMLNHCFVEASASPKLLPLVPWTWRIWRKKHFHSNQMWKLYEVAMGSRTPRESKNFTSSRLLLKLWTPWNDSWQEPSQTRRNFNERDEQARNKYNMPDTVL